MPGIYSSVTELIESTPLLELARLPENAGKTIVTVLPDTGERYLPTALFE